MKSKNIVWKWLNKELRWTFYQQNYTKIRFVMYTKFFVEQSIRLVSIFSPELLFQMLPNSFWEWRVSSTRRVSIYSFISQQQIKGLNQDNANWMMHMSFRSKSEQTSFLWCLIFNLVRQITAWYTALAAQCFCSWKLNVQVLLETWYSGRNPYHQSICSLANYFKTFTLNELQLLYLS